MADMNKRFDEAEERRNKRLSLTPERTSVDWRGGGLCLYFLH